MRPVPHPVLPKLIKRQPYNKYEKFRDQIPAVLERLINAKRGELQIIQEETGIPYPTLARWHQQLMKNTRFNPLQRKWGQQHKIFTDEEEDAIADYIVANFIQTNLHFTDEDFRQITLLAHHEKYDQYIQSEYLEERKKYKEFHC